MRRLWSLVSVSLLMVACSSSSSGGGSSNGDGGSGGGSPASSSSTSGTKTDAEYQADAVNQMHAALLSDLDDLIAAAQAIQDAAPTPADRGWDPTLDAAAIASMKTSWTKARTAYEHIEGALAPLFPDIDFSIDARYDDFLAALSAPDTNLFDGEGVTGMHAIERILYSDVTPQRVINFESMLNGYEKAAYPGTAADAATFKTGLCAKFVADATELKAQWTPANIDVSIAYQGLVSLMNEQREKVEKASTDEEESRYSQRTMADVRDNLSGTKAVYAFFQPWILSKSDASDPTKDGKTIDKAILASFAELDTAYAAVSGDSFPEPPATWSAENPSAEDLATPFGMLYSAVLHAVDPTVDGSAVNEMNDAAALLGFPLFM